MAAHHSDDFDGRTIVSVHEAKTHLSRLIKAVLAGTEVVIARGREPVVRLVPLVEPKAPTRKPGCWRGEVDYTDASFARWTDADLGHWTDKAP